MSVAQEPVVSVETESQPLAARVLKDKVALVTGGSRGIGRATALALAEAGAHVAVNYQRSAEAAKEVCAAARKYGVHCHEFAADVSREEEAVPMIESIVKEFGHVDVLVNNAGITRDKSFLKMT